MRVYMLCHETPVTIGHYFFKCQGYPGTTEEVAELLGIKPKPLDGLILQEIDIESLGIIPSLLERTRE